MLLERAISLWRCHLTMDCTSASGKLRLKTTFAISPPLISHIMSIKYKVKETFLMCGYRMVTFSNNVEPVNGFLLRYLHRKAVEGHQGEEQDPAGRQALLHVLDWVPQLWYHLHAFLEKHSTSDFLIGEWEVEKVLVWLRKLDEMFDSWI